VVSVTVAEAAAPDGQADSDAATVLNYAVNVAMLEDRGGTPDLTPAQIYEQYASDLLRELGHDADRIMAAARAVTAGMADKVGYPALVRHDALAIELCQMAVELTGQVLPGGYRPGSRASKVRGRDANPSRKQVKRSLRPTGHFLLRMMGGAVDQSAQQGCAPAARIRPRADSRSRRSRPTCLATVSARQGSGVVT
jgi:hypothetical protein